MTKGPWVLIAGVCFMAGLVPPVNGDAMTSARFRIKRAVISTSGAPTTSTRFQLNATTGQSTPLIDAGAPPGSTHYELFPGYSYLLVAQKDSDGDGLPDALEDGGCTDPLDADSDDDGILDGREDIRNYGVVDLLETDPCDGDTDGDGIQDGTETGRTLADIGPDTDGRFFIPDADPATTTDPRDPDSDNDGLSDGEEDADHNGAVDAGETDPNVSDRSLAMPWIPLLLLED